MTHRERSDYELALRLRREGKITTPGQPFEASDAAEIDSLLGRVLIPEQYNKARHGHLRIFNMRLVREVKGKQTDHP